MEILGIEIDIYSEEALNYLNVAVIKPVNRIIVKNLCQIEDHKNITIADTVIFGDLKKNEYRLFIYDNMDTDATQYVIPVGLMTQTKFSVDLSDYRLTQLFMNRKQFKNRISLLTRE